MTIKNHEFMFDAIGKVRQVTEQRNAIKEALLSERGFTDERQLSLEKRRLLEAKVDEVIARRGGNGGRQSGVISEAKQKMADKDYDKDGKIETSKDEVMGSRMRAAKMAGKMKDDDKTPPFTPDKKTVERGPGGPKSGAKWLAQAAKRRMMTKEEVEQMDEAYTVKLTKTKRRRDVKDDIDQPIHAVDRHYDIHDENGKKVGEVLHHYNQYGGHFYDGHLHGSNIPYDRQKITDSKQNARAFINGVEKTKWHSKLLERVAKRQQKQQQKEEVVKEGFFKQREIKKQDAERDRVRGTWEGGKKPYTPSGRDPRVDRVARSAREYEKTQPAHRRGRLPPDLE